MFSTLFMHMAQSQKQQISDDTQLSRFEQQDVEQAESSVSFSPVSQQTRQASAIQDQRSIVQPKMQSSGSLSFQDNRVSPEPQPMIQRVVNSGVVQREEDPGNAEAHGGADYNDPDYDDSEGASFLEWIRKNVVQAKFGPGVSGPKDVPGAGFVQVSYTRDGAGTFDFNNPSAKGTWSSPTNSGKSIVDLKPGITAGLFDKSQRSKHFSYADAFLVAKGELASISAAKAYRKGSWTWHHLTTPNHMVLVNMAAHRAYGHNGGVHIW